MKFIILVFWLGIKPATVTVEANSYEAGEKIVCAMPVASRTPLAFEHRDVDGNVLRVEYSPCRKYQKFDDLYERRTPIR